MPAGTGTGTGTETGTSPVTGTAMGTANAAPATAAAGTSVIIATVPGPLAGDQLSTGRCLTEPCYPQRQISMAVRNCSEGCRNHPMHMQGLRWRVTAALRSVRPRSQLPTAVPALCAPQQPTRLSHAIRGWPAVTALPCGVQVRCAFHVPGQVATALCLS